MNKQEAIEKIEKGKSNFNAWEDLVRNRAFEDALTIVRKIDEPEKPTVPQYVADWIEWCKRNSVTLLGAMSPIDEFGLAICNDKKVKSLDASKWATQNQETFAKAWLFGYEVEKEKLYEVFLKRTGAQLGVCVPHGEDKTQFTKVELQEYGFDNLDVYEVEEVEYTS